MYMFSSQFSDLGGQETPTHPRNWIETTEPELDPESPCPPRCGSFYVDLCFCVDLRFCVDLYRFVLLC